jgi:hypothetical protein
MNPRLLPLAAAALALVFASGAAHAQAKKAHRGDPKVVPVLNKDSGKLEAVLLLEPATDGANGAGARWRFGNTTLEATYGLQSGDSLALLCDRRSGMAPAIGQLASNCVLASLDGDKPGSGLSRHTSAGISLGRNGGKVGLSVGNGRDTLPAWISPGQLGGARYSQNDFSLFAEKSISREGFVSVGGTVARARLVPAADVPRLADQWNTRSLSVGGGYGAFGANIVGRVVNVPGESEVWKGLGLGLTWRTPWNGQLSVGADNVVTRGKNPFSIKGDQADEGTVPYVRYQQDL